MISVRTHIDYQPKRVTNAVDRAAYRNMGHAAASIRKDAAASIVKAEGPSRPGTPVHTHRRTFFRRAIRFHYDRKKQEAVIGPRYSVVGTVGEAHEKGLVYKGVKYPERPTMVPALERNLDRIAQSWAGSVG